MTNYTKINHSLITVSVNGVELKFDPLGYSEPHSPQRSVRLLNALRKGGTHDMTLRHLAKNFPARLLYALNVDVNNRIQLNTTILRSDLQSVTIEDVRHMSYVLSDLHKKTIS